MLGKSDIRKDKKTIIFIVEDDYPTAFSIKYRLESVIQFQLDIHIFSNVEKALVNNFLKPTIIILNHDLKHANGLESLGIVSKRFPKSSICIISDQTNKIVRSTSLKQGAKEYIQKDKDIFKNILDFAGQEIVLKHPKIFKSLKKNSFMNKLKMEQVKKLRNKFKK